MRELIHRPNKSLQATRDGRSSSAIAEDIISPACLSSERLRRRTVYESTRHFTDANNYPPGHA